MLDIGWSELLLIGVVALIVVGPKDLPVMFRTLGRLTARARAMARDFSRAMEDAARDTGLDDAASGLKGMASKKSLGLDALERATEKFEKWEPKFPAARGADAASALQPDPNLDDLDGAETDFEPEDLPAEKPAEKPVEKVAEKPAAKPAPAVVTDPVEPAPVPKAPRKPRAPKAAPAEGADPAPARPRKKTAAKKDEA